MRETLPNGIQVYKEIIFNELSGDDESFPWVALINIGNWHYSHRATTREKALVGLFAYMRYSKKLFEETLEKDKDRLNKLNKFLETENELHI